MAKKASIPERLRRQVQNRAQGRCEYCLVHESDVYFPHEPDHVIAEKHGGPTSLDNLALSCFYCNRFKGSDLASIDPATNKAVFLFNPREQKWKRHFRLNGALLEGITSSGRATVALLHMNDSERVAYRLGLIAIGHYPPQS
ncbi:MAG TPA: HNH endonuclease signature motif containing protein [Ktedonosporobacter sp.]|nr:HNH endonuclease signature motif containing protein [Ktedonosporobacter sp.]